MVRRILFPQYSMPVSTTFFALSGNGFRAYRRMTLVSLSGIIFKQREGYFLDQRLTHRRHDHEQ